MIKYTAYVYRRLNIFIDALFTFLAFSLAVYLRDYIDTGTFVLTQYYLEYYNFCFIPVILWPILLLANGLYPTDRLRTFKRASFIIMKSSLQGLIILLALLFVFKLQVVSRQILIQFFLSVILLLCLKEALVINYLHRIRRSGRGLRHVLVVGTFDSVIEITNKITEHSYLGLKAIGCLIPHSEMHKQAPSHIKVLGSLNDIDKVLRTHSIDHMIMTIDRSDYKEADNIIFSCEEQGVEIWLSANLFNIKAAKLDSDEVFGMPILVFRMGPKFSWEFLLKLIFDKVFTFLLGIVMLPVLIISAILIKITSKGPVIFEQKRCGLQGRIFTLYKFRTMCVGAHLMQNELGGKNIMKGPVFKLERDPRITFVGWFLRKTSIDELPQLWNVLRGDMSLIGPRPPIPEEVELYEGWQRRRLSMRPGITGLWQVSGRNLVSDFDQLAGLDLKYIDNWSLWLDLKIFFKTIWVVFSTRGAR